MGGLSIANEDIVAFNGTNFSLYFDGGDVGLGGLAIDAFAIVGDTEILMSFTKAGSVPGIAGTVDDSDLVKFTAISLGENNTAGSFELYFDGSDVGLTASSEDIDAVELLPDGTLLLSTIGSFTANELVGNDVDIFACNLPTTGPDTACESVTLYFDGAAAGLADSNHDVDALAVDGTGKVSISVIRRFNVDSLSGVDEDVFVCDPAGAAPINACNSWSLSFDGSAYGLGGNDIFAFDLP